MKTNTFLSSMTSGFSPIFLLMTLFSFAEAYTGQAKVLKRCMNRFCELFGQAVNFEKSKLYCSPNTNKVLAKEISPICGFPLTNDLGKYLGMPLVHSRISKQTYAEVIDKVQNRLAGWKSKTLNMAVRLTHIQVVTSSIPIYAMQTTKLHSCTTKTLDKFEMVRKIYLVNQKSVCRPKWLGGLGIKRVAAMNKAMLAKTSWRQAGSWFCFEQWLWDVLQAKAWGLFSGLQLAQELDLTHMLVESDSAVIIALLQSQDLDLHPLGTLLLNCQNLMAVFESCSISHILYERNMVVDYLAKSSIETDLGLCRLPTLPDFVMETFLDDLVGRCRPRAVPKAAVVVQFIFVFGPLGPFLTQKIFKKKLDKSLYVTDT